MTLLSFSMVETKKGGGGQRPKGVLIKTLFHFLLSANLVFRPDVGVHP